MLGPEGLTEKQTAFSDPEAVMAWAQAHRGGATADRVRRLAARLVRTDGVQPVGEAPSPGRPARYSTTELVDIEIATLALVEQGREAGAPSIEPERLEAIERADGIVLSAEQEAMVREVTTSPSRVICVVGLAGAGKTTATHAVGQVFRQAGIPVIGAAPSGVAAEKLQDETGIRSTTLHRLARRSPQRRRPGARFGARGRRGGNGRDPSPRAGARPRRAGGREGDPDRRPAPAPSGWRGRALRRHRRARGRGRAHREPTAARRTRTRGARARPRRRRTRLPRLRREARAARRLREPGHHARSTARRLVGARARRPHRERHARSPPSRRRRPEPARPRPHGHRRAPRE